jgi:hypothetical protein
LAVDWNGEQFGAFWLRFERANGTLADYDLALQRLAIPLACDFYVPFRHFFLLSLLRVSKRSGEFQQQQLALQIQQQQYNQRQEGSLLSSLLSVSLHSLCSCLQFDRPAFKNAKP